MKSDNSRITFDPRKHYSGVRLQQGRVQIDADANEQSDIVNYRIETETGDVIGLCGAPMHYPAFHIVGTLAGLSAEERELLGNTRPETGTAKIPTGFQFPDFLISAGRYYVDGISCENEQLISYLTQPDFPNAPPIDEPGLYVIYVDVWQRLLTALDDPSIREVALGGPDTATRTKTVWQVKHWLAVDRNKAKLRDGNCLSTFGVFEDLIAPSSGKLSARSKRAEATTDPCVVSPVAGYTGLENQLYRIEIHDSGAAIEASSSSATRMTTVANENAQIKAGGNWTRQSPIEIFSAANPMKGKLAFVQNVEGPRRGAKTLTLNIDVSQVPFSDRLVREAGATFKWSRDNGVVVTAIQSISGVEVTVHDLGPDDTLGFKEGQWVEISDDALELGGLPGQLAQISKVDSALKRITLETAVDPLDASNRDGVNKALHPKLRRWDGVGVVKFDPESEDDNFLDLENGVQISFSRGTLRTGDYWTVPARTATADTQAGNIDWPVDGSNQPLAQSPFGVEHHYCRLAMAKWEDGKFTFEDCRSLFPPITELTTMVYVSGDGQEAMPDTQLQQPLQVGVFNGRWPVENATVRFSISSAAGRFGVPITDSNLDKGLLTAIDGTGTPTNTITVQTDENGIAGCFWKLDPTFGPLVDPAADRTSQQVEARLLDAQGRPTPALVRFDANLSVADEVAYFPGRCAALQEDKTVQRALDRLSHLVSLYEVSGNNQEVMPSKELASLVVLAANRCGPVTKQEVTFTVISGEGKVEPETVFTSEEEGSEGEAACTWKLDPETPRQEVEARLTGEGSFAAATTVRFVANLSTADQVSYNPRTCPTLQQRTTVQEAIEQLSQLISLYEFKGNNQVVMSQAEMQKIQVLVANKCGPVTRQRVQFKPLAKSGSVNPAEAETDGSGIAETTWTLDRKEPIQHVEATLVGVPAPSLAPPTAMTFNAYLSRAEHVLYAPGNCGPLQESGTVQLAIDKLSQLVSLYEVSGNNPIAVPNTKQKIQVLAANKCGPVANQRVDLNLLVAGQGTIVPAPANIDVNGKVITDVNGIVTADWTFGTDQNQQMRATLADTPAKSLAAPTSVLFNANRSATGGSQGGGCEITVGSGGQFPRLDTALTSLLGDQNLVDICLCLLPGDHVTGGLNITRPNLHLKITGCGRGSRLLFTETAGTPPTGPSSLFGSLASFAMRDLDVFGENYSLSFDVCDEVTFVDCYLTQENLPTEEQSPSFIRIANAKAIRFEGNVVSSTLPLGQNPFSPDVVIGDTIPGFVELFRRPSKFEFEEKSAIFAAQLASLDVAERRDLGDAASRAVAEVVKRITEAELASYNNFIETLLNERVRENELPRVLQANLAAIRTAALAAVPSVAIVLTDAKADTRIENNRIAGVVSLYGPPATTTLKQQDLNLIDNALGRKGLVFAESLANLRIRNNALYRITVSEETVAALRMTTGAQRNLTGFYRRCFVIDNAFTGGDNLLVMEQLALNSDTFERESNLEAGAVVASAASYIGNFASDDIRLFDATLVSEKVANVVIRIANP